MKECEDSEGLVLLTRERRKHETKKPQRSNYVCSSTACRHGGGGGQARRSESCCVLALSSVLSSSATRLIADASTFCNPASLCNTVEEEISCQDSRGKVGLSNLPPPVHPTSGPSPARRQTHRGGAPRTLKAVSSLNALQRTPHRHHTVLKIHTSL